ncbi:hypothetical protein JCM10908_003058 [Rhodotorula pacifica]|uniref:BSD domain-containing protein n=1 Tax=Rhodotorula pacifica TaxID=1495444 RepID=UPI00317C7CD7
MDQLGGFVSTPPRSSTPAAASTDDSATPATSSADSSTSAAHGGDAARESAATPAGQGTATAEKARGLDEEVASIVGGFTSFWGRVKKQSVAALHEAEKQYETARADLSPLLNQARTQLDHISEQTRAEIQRLSEAPAPNSSGTDVIIGPDGIPIVLDEAPAVAAAPAPAETATKSEKGKGVERGEEEEVDRDATASNAAETESQTQQQQQQTPAAAASAFFSKWQAQLASNPNVKDLSRNISSLQSNLSTNLHQIQNQLTHLDLTEGQKVADRYLHKGEAWFQEFSAEVAHLAKEAVKVVPPTGAGSAAPTTGRSGFERAGTPVMTRRDMVMHKLRTDTSLLLIDPAQPPPPATSVPAQQTDLSASTSAAPLTDTREAYAAFLSSVQDRGGIEGDAFRADVERELLDGGEALVQTRDQLVPAQVPEEVFWTRYFFRKQCVEEEEERRKKVLQVAQQDDDDFSWDMDDEESVASPRVPQEPAMSARAVPAPTVPAAAGASSSPASAETTPIPPTVSKVAEPSSAVPSASAQQPAIAAAPSSSSTSTATGPISAPQVRAMSNDTSPTTSSESPRASSDGTSSFDIVGERSGHPSADEHERAAARSAAAGASAGMGGPASTAAEQEEEEDDSDWE